jgi:hypothetical protein
MSLRAFFKQMKKELTTSPRQRAEQLDFPTGTETGLRHPVNGTYMLLRDDYVAEVGAGTAAKVVLDGANQQATVRATAVSVEGQFIHLHAPPGNVYLGYRAFNPYWYTASVFTNLGSAIGASIGGTTGEGIGRNIGEDVDRGGGGIIGAVDPAGRFTPTALTETIPNVSLELLSRLPIVVGAPQLGQANILLGQYLKAEPIFGPDEQLVILSTNLSHLIKSLSRGLV